MSKKAKNNFIFNDPNLWKISTEGNFGFCELKNGNQPIARFPYFLRKKVGFKFILMPIYTPYIDIELFENVEPGSAAAKIKYEKKILDGLIENLPKASYINIRFKPGIQNLLPFHWSGFSIYTRYTYLINTSDFANEREIFDGFHSTIKKDIERADKEYEIETTTNVDGLYACLKDDFGVNKSALPASQKQLKQLVEYLVSSENGVQLVAKRNEKVVSSIVFAFDDEFVHYYLGGTMRKERSSGISALLLWKGIQLAKEKDLIFNFEGSMIPEIEKFFRKFNGILTPYYEIKKFNSKCLELANHFLHKL